MMGEIKDIKCNNLTINPSFTVFVCLLLIFLLFIVLFVFTVFNSCYVMLSSYGPLLILFISNFALLYLLYGFYSLYL